MLVVVQIFAAYELYVVKMRFLSLLSAGMEQDGAVETLFDPK